MFGGVVLFKRLENKTSFHKTGQPLCAPNNYILPALTSDPGCSASESSHPRAYWAVTTNSLRLHILKLRGERDPREIPHRVAWLEARVWRGQC